MRIVKRYSFLLYIILPVIALVMLRYLPGNHFYPGARENATPALTGENLVRSDSIEFLEGDILLIEVGTGSGADPQPYLQPDDNRSGADPQPDDNRSGADLQPYLQPDDDRSGADLQPYLQPDDFYNRGEIRRLKKFKGKIVLVSENPSEAAIAWMILAQQGVRDLYIATDIGSGEEVNYKFLPDTTGGIL